MSPEEIARATASVVVDIPSRFMMDAATYERGAELGFEGIDFYFAGRGGALGDVDPDVVAAAFVFFHRDRVAEAWLRSRVMPARRAAAAFAGAAHRWADGHLADSVDWARLSQLEETVIAAAAPAGAPLFAGWRNVPVPTDPKQAALHRMNVLRELRGGLHGAAVLAAGLSPAEAVSARTPHMAAFLGWGEALADDPGRAARWEAAEQTTNQLMGGAIGALPAGEQGELAELLTAAAAAVR